MAFRDEKEPVQFGRDVTPAPHPGLADPPFLGRPRFGQLVLESMERQKAL